MLAAFYVKQQTWRHMMTYQRENQLIISEDTLPDKLSSLLRVGVDAMDYMDRSQYAPDSAVMVHDGGENGACRVTLAGAVLASRFCADVNVSYHWADLTGPASYEVYEKLQMLGALSSGDLRNALFIVHEGLMEDESEEAFEFASARFDERVEKMSPELRAYLKEARQWDDQQSAYSGWESYGVWRENAIAFVERIRELGG